MMRWEAGLILCGVAAVLRQALRLGANTTPPARGLIPLSPEREAIYQPVAMEVGAQSAILAICLNDAIEERDSGNREIAGRLVELSASEWEILAGIALLLLRAITKHLPVADVTVPVRKMVAHRFKSHSMVDYLRMHEIFDQVVFRAKARFQLNIRVLRRAVATLTADFERTHHQLQRTLDPRPYVWSQLDLDFHDFDLITKEALLAFRTLLDCLADEHLADLTRDLEPILRRGAGSTSPSSRPKG